LVLTGHVHDYQRFSAPLGGQNNVPFIVAGAGGYNKQLHTLAKVFHDAQQNHKLPVQIEGEPDILLENFNDAQHGYLRITVTKSSITADYVAVPDPTGQVKDAIVAPFDTVVIPLK
jgi:hypothetical protein